MTDQQHPINPPPRRFKQWEDAILSERENVDLVLDCAWRDGFRAGADHELEACCEWLEEDNPGGFWSGRLRAARRPKPPSLKEQALEALQRAEEGCRPIPYDRDIIRRALESLPS